eukprot:NODE_682_length_5232_cov_0.148646.p6 type:complete len:100 gc:universal NODE_682_length_5232_cov_0.148646:3263-3562(+)
MYKDLTNKLFTEMFRHVSFILISILSVCLILSVDMNFFIFICVARYDWCSRFRCMITDIGIKCSLFGLDNVGMTNFQFLTNRILTQLYSVFLKYHRVWK